MKFEDPEYKVLLVDTGKNYGALYWKGESGGVEEVFSPKDAGIRAYCLDPGGCTCPINHVFVGDQELREPPIPVVESRLLAFTGGAAESVATIEVSQLPCLPPPTCSETAKTQALAIIGVPIELASIGAGKFSFRGTIGCLWMNTSGGIDDYVILGRRAPSYKYSTAAALESFNRSHKTTLVHVKARQ